MEKHSGRFFVRRPLAIASFFFLLTVAAAYFVSIKLSVVMFLVATTVFLFFFFAKSSKMERKNERLLLLMILIFMSVALFVSFLSMQREKREIQAVREDDALLIIAVTETEDRGNAVRVIGDVKQADGETITKISVLFYCYRDFPEIGDEIACRLSLYDGENIVNNRIRINGKIDEWEEKRANVYPNIQKLAAFKSGIQDALYRAMPEREASIAIAMVTGERTEMSVSLQRTFQRAGISHIVVVSGLHISMLLGILSFFLKRIRLPILQVTGAALCILAVMLFYGFTPSVVRACVMGAFVFFGEFFYYRSDGATSLAIAAVLILLFDPRAILNVSFQLSFACCFAIAVIYPVVEKEFKGKKRSEGMQIRKSRIGRFLSKLREAFLLSLTINIVTLPVLILNGIPVSLVSPLTNPLVVPLVSVSLVLSILTAGFFFISSVLSGIFGIPASFVIGVIIKVSSFLGDFRYAAIDVNLDLLKYWAIFSIASGILYALFLKKRMKIYFATVFILLPLVIVMAADWIYRIDKPEALLYNGSALLLKDGDDAAIIAEKISDIDVEYLAAYLMTRGIDEVDEILLLEDNIDTETVRKQFSETEIHGKRQENQISVGRIDASIEEECVIITYDGKRVVVTSEGDGDFSDADALLLWRSAKSYSEQQAKIIVVYEDIVSEKYGGFTYGFAEQVEVLFEKELLRVRIR